MMERLKVLWNECHRCAGRVNTGPDGRIVCAHVPPVPYCIVPKVDRDLVKDPSIPVTADDLRGIAMRLAPLPYMTAPAPIPEPAPEPDTPPSPPENEAPEPAAEIAAETEPSETNPDDPDAFEPETEDEDPNGPEEQGESTSEGSPDPKPVRTRKR